MERWNARQKEVKKRKEINTEIKKYMKVGSVVMKKEKKARQEELKYMI